MIKNVYLITILILLLTAVAAMVIYPIVYEFIPLAWEYMSEKLIGIFKIWKNHRK